MAIDDRDAERLGRGLDGEDRRGRRDAVRLDPVEIGGVRDPVAVILHRGVSITRAGRTPKYRPAARIVPAAIVPTLMYRSPVADSIERVSAVLTAAQQTIKREHEPHDQAQPDEQRQVAGERAERRTARGSGTRPDPGHEQDELHADDGQQRARQQDQRRLGELRRHEIPVAQDHRREDAAGRGGQHGQLDEQAQRPERPATPGERAAHERQDPGPERDQLHRTGDARTDPAGDRAPARPPRRMPAGRSAAAHPRSRRARPATSPSEEGSAPSLSHASTPKATAQAVANPRNPRVALERRRSRTTAAYEPRARPVRTVQLMKARFWAICAAGTAPV